MFLLGVKRGLKSCVNLLFFSLKVNQLFCFPIRLTSTAVSQSRRCGCGDVMIVVYTQVNDPPEVEWIPVRLRDKAYLNNIPPFHCVAVGSNGYSPPRLPTWTVYQYVLIIRIPSVGHPSWAFPLPRVIYIYIYIYRLFLREQHNLFRVDDFSLKKVQ